ncbi:glycosyltransferase family 2 protein [Bradyrhizobium genosp. L]|uniref:glycosyltransferase family 2 protein n=1 Tax=Bradyrhizobium genosp. L TaxID=83637 RepID=UPI0018A31397|nr:glycosyltransferase family A protein [Bradyrhizobium genosp. L]QPF86541.1 glycosyltransferase family 2 protein [Bradyrhizobium genosp. L]
MATVDVVIPCYNYGRYLESCVNSVLSQSIADVRILIIDDASTDNSQAVAESIAACDRRVSLLAHPQNMGHIKTYNEGIAWLESDYFLLLSADDLLVPGTLERAIRIMDDNPDVVMTYGDGIEWNDAFPLPAILPSEGNWVRQDLLRDMCGCGANLVVTATAVVRTSAQLAVGDYDIALPHSADMALWLKFAAHGAIAKIHAAQAIYRRHASNMSEAYYARKLLDYQQRKAAFDSFFLTTDGLSSDSDALRVKADQKLARLAYWSGVGQLLRGHTVNATALLRFATNLDTTLYYLPPLGQLLRTPRLGRVMSAIASDATSRLFESKRPLGLDRK